MPSSELESRLVHLDRLLAEMIAGEFQRNTFQHWEIEVLLDIQDCIAGEPNRNELLRRYQKAAHRWFERGGRTFLMLSDYLAKRHCRPPVNGAFASADVR